MELTENLQMQIKIKPKEIMQKIQENGQFENEDFIIKKWEDDDLNEDKDDDLMFAVSYKDKQIPFIGIVNYIFKREGYCLNKYKNSDIYFGYYNNDKREKQGIYCFNPKIIQNEKNSEFYFGLWKEDLMNGKGIYLWLRENINNKPFSNFDEANFTAFLGNFEKNNFQKGALITKKNNNYFLYYGTIGENFKKEGIKCFYFCAQNEELCYGTFKNGEFKDGYIGKFNNDGKLINMIKYKKDKKEKYTEFDKISETNQKKIGTLMFKFRNVIMSKDYFGDLYEIFGKIIEIKEKINNLDIFCSEKYVKIMNDINLFHKVTLYDDIQKYVES